MRDSRSVFHSRVFWRPIAGERCLKTREFNENHSRVKFAFNHFRLSAARQEFAAVLVERHRIGHSVFLVFVEI
jgi:hypothetical protein